MGRFIEKITPFMVMDILQQARDIKGCIHMEIGEPDLPPSEKVVEAYIKAIKEKKFYYTSAKGLIELREKISKYYYEEYNVNISPDRIIITPGTSGAFLVVFGILINNKDKRIVLSDPCYPCYKNFVYFLDSKPIFIPVSALEHYQIMPDKLMELKNVSAIMVSSPSNPTGTLYKKEIFKKLIEIAEKKNIWFISDEIYHGLIYDSKPYSALEFSDNTIVINGFSKYFCMPGFRIGWVILPNKLVRKAEIIIQNIFISTNTPAQYAAQEAFDKEHLKIVKETFKKRRDFLYNMLKDIFIIKPIPEGAFYIWANISQYSNNSIDFCKNLLQKKGVAITPGIDFGLNNTEKFVRFAYTRDISELAEGVKRIKEFISLI